MNLRESASQMEINSGFVGGVTKFHGCSTQNLDLIRTKLASVVTMMEKMTSQPSGCDFQLSGEMTALDSRADYHNNRIGVSDYHKNHSRVRDYHKKCSEVLDYHKHSSGVSDYHIFPPTVDYGSEGDQQVSLTPDSLQSQFQVQNSDLEFNRENHQLGYRSGVLPVVSRDTMIKKIEMPIFDDKHIQDWLRDVEKFFTVGGFREEDILEMVALSAEGRMKKWFAWVLKRGGFRDWLDFKHKLLLRFAESIDDEPDTRLFSIEQTASVTNYLSETEENAVMPQLPVYEKANSKKETIPMLDHAKEMYVLSLGLQKTVAVKTELVHTSASTKDLAQYVESLTTEVFKIKDCRPDIADEVAHKQEEVFRLHAKEQAELALQSHEFHIFRSSYRVQQRKKLMLLPKSWRFKFKRNKHKEAFRGSEITATACVEKAEVLLDQFAPVTSSLVAVNQKHESILSKETVHEKELVKTTVSPTMDNVSVNLDDCHIQNCSSPVILLRNYSLHAVEQEFDDKVNLEEEEVSNKELVHAREMVQVAKAPLMDQTEEYLAANESSLMHTCCFSGCVPSMESSSTKYVAVNVITVTSLHYLHYLHKLQATNSYTQAPQEPRDQLDEQWQLQSKTGKIIFLHISQSNNLIGFGGEKKLLRETVHGEFHVKHRWRSKSVKLLNVAEPLVNRNTERASVLYLGDEPHRSLLRSSPLFLHNTSLWASLFSRGGVYKRILVGWIVIDVLIWLLSSSSESELLKKDVRKQWGKEEPIAHGLLQVLIHQWLKGRRIKRLHLLIHYKQHWAKGYKSRRFKYKERLFEIMDECTKVDPKVKWCHSRQHMKWSVIITKQRYRVLSWCNIAEQDALAHGGLQLQLILQIISLRASLFSRGKY